MAKSNDKANGKAADVVKTEASTDVLATKRAELVEAKRSHAAGELVNPRVLGNLRRDIARGLTQRNSSKKEEA